MNGRTDERTDGRMNGRTEGRMNGRRDRRTTDKRPFNQPTNESRIDQPFQLLFPAHTDALSCLYSPQSQSNLDQLMCYYYNKHPLLVIKPAKLEMASLKPNIYLMHDVIRDTDIEFIKDLAAPRVSN